MTSVEFRFPGLSRYMLPLLLGPAIAVPSAFAAQAQARRFPPSHELFARLAADPRQAQTSLRYYRLNGKNTADVALGNTWGMRRWEIGGTRVQWNLEGMAYSRFLLSGGVNEFQTVDFFANVPIELRRGAWSARLTPFHESSHLGDDYIRRTNDKGARFSVEGVRAVISWEPLGPTVRLYGGGGELLHAVPSTGRSSAQAGFELTTPELGWLEHPCWLYLAHDLQARGANAWNAETSTEVGLRVAFAEVVRAMRVHANYHHGRSPFAQFSSHRESLLSMGASFDF